MPKDAKAQDAQMEAAVDEALGGAPTQTDDPAVVRAMWEAMKQRWSNSLTQIRLEFRVAEAISDEATKKRCREVATNALKAIAFIDAELAKI